MGWCKSKSKSKEECAIRTGSCGMTNGCKMQSSRINCTPCSSQNRGNWDSVCATSHCPKSNYDFVTSPSACHCGRPKSRSRSRSKSKSRAKSKSKSRSNSKSKKSKTKCDHQHSKTGCKIGCTNKKPCVSCCRGISCPNDGDKKKTKKSKSVGCMGKSKNKTKCKNKI